jgi:hypothetical protein
MAIVHDWHRGASVLIYRLGFFGFRSSFVPIRYCASLRKTPR